MVKLCQINKDDKNVGTVSEEVFSGSDFPSVILWSCMAVNDELPGRTSHYVNANIYNVLM